MNPFSYFSKKRREQRKKLKELRQFSSVFSTLDRLEQSGLLVWDQKSRRYFISQSLAAVMIAQGAEGWVNFIQNLYLHAYWQEIQQVTDDTMLKAELAAVRKASVGDRSASPLGSSKNHETVQLSRADVERIRLAARQQVAESDIEPPKVEPFEMFIVEDTVDAKPKIIAVGFFDPETNDMELAPWSEVEPLIKKTQEP
jgi:hypothetical protein